jgi:hypothetical protein
VAVCVLWVRSYSHIAGARHYGGGGEFFAIESNSGGIYFRTHRDTGRLAKAFAYSWRFYEDKWAGPWEKNYGIEPRRWQGVQSFPVALRWGKKITPERVVIVSHWVVALLTAGLPARWLILRRRGSFRPGLCPACGYDLRATPGRCPECGTAAAVSPP